MAAGVPWCDAGLELRHPHRQIREADDFRHGQIGGHQWIAGRGVVSVVARAAVVVQSHMEGTLDRGRRAGGIEHVGPIFGHAQALAAQVGDHVGPLGWRRGIPAGELGGREVMAVVWRGGI